MKLGLVTYNLASEWDLGTIEKNCSETGFEGVELRTGHAHGVEFDLGIKERAALRARFADSAVEIVGLGSVFEYDTPDESELKRQIAGTKEYIRLAHDLGVGGIKVRPNRVHDERGIERERTFAQIGQSLQECAVFASDWGVQIRLEVHGRVTCEPAHMRTIMDHAPHPNARVCWNSNNTDVVDGSIDGSFALLEKRIGMVHITELWSDYPWRRLFSLLRDTGYSGYCLAEISGSSDSLRLMRYYRALWLALSGLEADA